jgi:hypothetical protein
MGKWEHVEWVMFSAGKNPLLGESIYSFPRLFQHIRAWSGHCFGPEKFGEIPSWTVIGGLLLLWPTVQKMMFESTLQWKLE